jgi:murein L,D-transpeptidase YcbB/YkuD
MALSSAIKRSKRTLANIERNIVKPFLYKAVWRFMQFDEENFPVRDINFVTHTSLGITARELEQQQLIQLLQTVPPESPAFMVMLKAIYDNSSLSNKEELVTVIEQMMQPDPQAQELQQLQTQLAIQKEQAEIEERQSRTQENLADRLKTLADIELGQDKLDTELQGQILDLLAARANKQNGSEMNGITEPGNGEVLQRPAQPNQQG